MTSYKIELIKCTCIYTILTLKRSLAAFRKCPAFRYSSIALTILFFSSRWEAYLASSESISLTLWVLASSMAVFHWFRSTQLSMAFFMWLHYNIYNHILMHLKIMKHPGNLQQKNFMSEVTFLLFYILLCIFIYNKLFVAANIQTRNFLLTKKFTKLRFVFYKLNYMLT